MKKQMKLFTYMTKPFVLLVLLFALGVGNVCGWNMMYLVGDHWNSWSDNYRMWETSDNSGMRYVYIYMEKDYMFRFNMTISETSYKVGVGSAQNLDDNDTGVRVYKYESGDPAHINYSGEADHTYSGIICVNSDQKTKDGEDDANTKPFIWLTRPSVKIRHNWNGTSWSDQTMDDKHNGKYEYIGQFGGNYTYAGITDNEYTVDGSPLYKKFTDATLEGSPVVGNRCLFEFNSSGYVGVDDKDHHRGSLKIIKIDTVTYLANGATGGSAPAVTEATYNRASTLATNTGSLAKANYYFNGWNTKADGTGKHFEAGGSIDTTTNVTLYAEWTPQWTIKGSDSFAEDDDDDEMGDWKVFNGLPFVSGNTHRGTITLAAHTAYYFKVYDRVNSAFYGCGTRNNDYTFVGQTDVIPIESPGYNLLLLTTQAGAYTFEWNDDTKSIKVIYPNTIVHPSYDYVYIENYTGGGAWGNYYVHYFYDDGGEGETMTTWGSDNPHLSAYTSIGGTNYYYIPILTAYPNFIAKNQVGNSTDGHETSKMYTSGHAGQLVYWKDEQTGWTWGDLTVHIGYDDRGANTKVDPTSLDLKFNSDVLTNLTSTPLKDHYDFGGFYTNSDGTGTQLIDASGKWIASVSNYTDASKHWIHEGTPTTIYAKWTEHEYTITTAVSPAGAGSISVGESTTAKYVTASGDITATANAGWVFKEWQFSHEGEDYDVYVSDGTMYHSTDATIRVLADHDGTLTAVFEPRYYLVGGEITGPSDGGSGTSSGMPGWDNYTDPFNVITSSPVLATCSLTLDANKHFYIEVRDKADEYSYGKSSETLEDNETLTFTDKDNKVLFHSNGGTAYTFKITGVDGSGRPTVSVERPYQINYGWKYQNIDDAIPQTGNTGGTATVVNKDDGDATISAGAWVKYGTRTQYQSTPTSGYTVSWYSSDDYSTGYITNLQNFNHTADHTGNGYAKFTEKTTTVSLENDGHGKVQIGGVDKTGTTVGVTTTRSLTAVPNDGYAFKDWSKPSGDDITLSSTSANPTTLTGQGDGLDEGQRVYASFSEIPRSITASAGTGGTVGAANYTAYIDTKTDISATPATGYKFKEWQETGGTSYVTFDNPNSASTKIKATGNATIQAVFEPRWAIAGSWKTYPESAAWDADTYKLGNIGRNGSKDTCYVEITLPANSDLTFKIVDRGTDGTVAIGSYVDYGNNTTATQYMKHNNHTAWKFGKKSSGYYDCGITTTGGGTYRFAFNITDTTLTVIYPASYQSNFGWKYADGAGSLHDGDNGGTITVTASDGGSHTISSGDWVAAGASITYLASPAAGYAFGGWFGTAECTGDPFNSETSWTDGTLDAISNSYTKFVPVTLYFTGNGSGVHWDWKEVTNWSPACVPTIDHDVVIQKPVEVYMYGAGNIAKAKSIVIDKYGDNTGRLVVKGPYGLVVKETIQKKNEDGDLVAPESADLRIESTSYFENGALAVKGFTEASNKDINATVIYYTKSRLVGGWSVEGEYDGFYLNQFIGTPLRSSNIYDYYGCWIYKWDPTAGEGKGDWVYESTSMTPFQGYDILNEYPESPSFWLTGPLVYSENQNLTLDYTGSGGANGSENMFANSWMAPIDVTRFKKSDFAGDDADKMEATIYVFNSGTPNEWTAREENYGTGPGQYLVMPIEGLEYTGDIKEIQSMQAFSVYAKASSATLTLDYDRLVYQPLLNRTETIDEMRAPRRMKAESVVGDPEKMSIRVVGEQSADKIHLLIRDDFNEGFDNGWDASKMFGESFAPQLYTITSAGKKLSIDCTPDAEGTVVGFRKGDTDVTYTFSFEYNGAEMFYLNDLKEQTSTLISAENTYEFTSAADDSEARFIISASPIAKTPTGIGNGAAAASGARKIIIDNHVYIIRGGQMYNLTGTLVK